jgi:hypothetical protein
VFIPLTFIAKKLERRKKEEIKQRASYERLRDDFQPSSQGTCCSVHKGYVKGAFSWRRTAQKAKKYTLARKTWGGKPFISKTIFNWTVNASPVRDGRNGTKETG